MAAMPVPGPASVAAITRRILILRDRRVMLDADLAALYGVAAKRLNEQVKRNRCRFPTEFMFEAHRGGVRFFKVANATLKPGRGKHRKYAHKVFTEHGALMLASVLNSARAIEVSVLIVQAFVQMREYLRSHSELAARIDDLERKLVGHDTAIANLLMAIRHLAIGESPPKRPIGFTADLK